LADMQPRIPRWMPAFLGWARFAVRRPYGTQGVNLDDHSNLGFSFNGQLLPLPDAEDSTAFLKSNMLKRLSEEKAEIAHDIEMNLRENIADEQGARVDVRVGIVFREGSVLFSGFVILLEGMATIAGAADFVERTVRAIQHAVEWSVARRAKNYFVEARVAPGFRVAQNTPRTSAESQLFSLRTTLLAITLLNTVFFVGGSVYTGVSVNSIHERYKEAEAESEKVRQDYEKYRAGLEGRLGDIEGQLRATGKKAEDDQSRAKQLSNDLSLLEGQAQNLNQSITLMKKRGSGWVSLKLAFYQANWALKTFLALIPLYGLLVLGIIVFIWTR
jgi:hypothetical protein